MKNLCVLFLSLLACMPAAAQTYCIPVTNNNCRDALFGNLYYGNITNVSFAGMSNSSVHTTCGITGRGYSDYSGTVTPPVVNADGVTAHAFSVSRHTTANTNYRMGIWIDLNNDGVFDNTSNNLVTNPAGERFLEAFMGNNSPITGTIILPAGVSPGNKRMRVRAMYTQTGYSGPSPCATQDYGEAEDYTITVSGSAAAVITTGNPGSLVHCPGGTIDIPFAISGNFNGGNVFTAQLSDATGSFANPVTLGTLNGNTQGSIGGTIPANTAAGSNYRVRVTGSDPSVTGSDNGSNITVLALPQVPQPISDASAVCQQGTVKLTASPSPADASVTWLYSTDGNSFSPLSGATGNQVTTPPLTQTTWFRAVAANTCGTSESPSLQVSVSAVTQITISRSPETFNLCNGPITLSVPENISNFIWSNSQAGNTLIVNQPGVYGGRGTDASGCQADATEVTIIQTNPPALTTEPSGNFITCSNSARLSAGSGFATYTWSDGQNAQSIDVNTAGAYTVTGTDENGCRRTSDTVFVTFDNSVPAPLAVTPAGPVFFCAGSTVTLTAEEGYDVYVWTGGINGRSIEVSQAGVYSVSAVKADGCRGKSAETEVLEKDLPVASFTYEQPGGYLILFTNTSQGGVSYTWTINGSSTTSENASYTFPFDGTYPVTLVAVNECGADTLETTVEVKKFTGIEGVDGYRIRSFYRQDAGRLILYPAAMAGEQVLVSVFNAAGQLVFTESTHVRQDQTVSADLRGLESGLYVCSVQTPAATGRSSFSVH